MRLARIDAEQRRLRLEAEERERVQAVRLQEELAQVSAVTDLITQTSIDAGGEARGGASGHGRSSKGGRGGSRRPLIVHSLIDSDAQAREREISEEREKARVAREQERRQALLRLKEQVGSQLGCSRVVVTHAIQRDRERQQQLEEERKRREQERVRLEEVCGKCFEGE